MPYEDDELLADCAAVVLARHDPDSWQHSLDESWHFVRPRGHRRRAQGWKLHIPATPLSACLVLSRCVDVLARHRCAFKFARALRQLQLLIDQNADRAAAGKFITVYPDDDAHAVRIAEDLHEATLGLPGQVIVTDRRLREGSQVYYRYGAFTPDFVLNDSAEYVAVLHTPSGEPVPDQRGVGKPEPDWVTDPFRAAAPVAVPKSVRIADRFEVRSAIRQSNRGGVYLATDTETGDDVILKRFRRHVGAAADGSDSRNRARAEARLCDVLGAQGASPRFLGIFAGDGDMFVAQERIDGVVLRRFVARGLARTGTGTQALDTALVLDFAEQLVRLLEKVHEAGYAFGDLTPNNVMVTGGRLVLIDLESALRPWEVTTALKTPGYAAPEQLSRERLVGPAPRTTADLYALGATLFHLATGLHPPTHRDTRLVDLARVLARRNPAAAAVLPALTGLLDPDPAARPSLADVRTLLAAPRTPAPPTIQPGPDTLIDDLLDELVSTRDESADTPWPLSDAARKHDPCSVHIGPPGVLLVLNQALRAGYDVTETASATARWIVDRLPGEPRVLPGLLFGRAGTAVTLAETGALLEESTFIEAGLTLAARLPTRWPVPDVYHGTAGAGLALLSLWHATGDRDLLTAAVRCADGLLEDVQIDGEQVTWTATSDFVLAGKTHWGFAHGVAGIGTFLTEAGGATGDGRYVEVARRCVSTLAAIADHDGDAAFWRSGEPDEGADNVRLTGLCSGSTGVGMFLLRHFALTGEAVSGELAASAASAVRSALGTALPVWCHGLAGSGDFLLDCAEVLGDPRYREWAEEAAELIGAHAVRHHGRFLLPDESGALVSAYGNGFGGPLSFLLRLRHGGPRPLLGRPAPAVRDRSPGVQPSGKVIR